ncbi:hypothetical protein KAJ89_01275 [Candidatus Parcubacteria bacterium]|nr:hypothetical protein [Candidatus Parcubacteria bacterium]
MLSYIIPGVIVIVIVYFTARFLFDILLRGFLPFIPSRPWVVEQIINEFDLPVGKQNCIAFSTGRSGFFHALERKYPQAKLTAIEPNLFPFLVSWVQTLVRETKINVVREEVFRVNVRDADFVYCHLYPNDLRGMGKKFKFECRPDTIIVSTGFNIMNLNLDKAIPLEDRRGKLDWLSKNQKLFQRKSKKFKKENKAFFYKI